MEEQQDEKPKVRFKYHVDLGGNRGRTVMKFTEREAARRGIPDSDKVDGQEIVAEEDVASKAKAPANKAKSTADK